MTTQVLSVTKPQAVRECGAFDLAHAHRRALSHPLTPDESKRDKRSMRKKVNVAVQLNLEALIAHTRARYESDRRFDDHKVLLKRMVLRKVTLISEPEIMDISTQLRRKQRSNYSEDSIREHIRREFNRNRAIYHIIAIVDSNDIVLMADHDATPGQITLAMAGIE